jgi:transitional endoplasmic reticulum ATPase
MIKLREDFEFDGYKVTLLLKEGIYNDSYRVLNDRGQSFFMKIYDLKKMPKTCINADGQVKEIAYCRTIQNKNIISYKCDGKITVGSVGGMGGESYPYMITDYFTGELLADKLQRMSVLPCDDALTYIFGVLDGLEYLHNMKLVHNDITPRNVMFDFSDDNATAVKIIDMGHTSPATTGVPDFLTQDLDPLFRAPETFAGIFDEQSDVYSAAAVLFTMLTGKAPWWIDPMEKGNDINRIRMALKLKRKSEPLDFADAEGKIPDVVKNAIVKALTSNCDNRFNVASFRRALRGEEEPVEKPGKDESTASRQESSDSTGATEGTMQINIPVQKGSGNGFADIAGMQELKDMLTKKVIFVLKNKELAQKYKLTPPNGMLLYGPPGCGKSFFAEKFAEESGFNFMLVKASDLGSTYIHGSQGKISELFKKAAATPPTVICFDEFDALVPNRSDIDNSSLSGEVNEFLSQLNNCSEKGVFVVGTSNRPDKIDPAVLRTGRIDKLVYVPLPDSVARREMFKIHLKGRPCGEIDFEKLAALTEKYVSSDITFIVNDAAMAAAFVGGPITQEFLENSIKCTHPSVGQDAIRQYEREREQFENLEHNNGLAHVGFIK